MGGEQRLFARAGVQACGLVLRNACTSVACQDRASPVCVPARPPSLAPLSASRACFRSGGFALHSAHPFERNRKRAGGGGGGGGSLRRRVAHAARLKRLRRVALLEVRLHPKEEAGQRHLPATGARGGAAHAQTICGQTNAEAGRAAGRALLFGRRRAGRASSRRQLACTCRLRRPAAPACCGRAGIPGPSVSSESRVETGKGLVRVSCQIRARRSRPGHSRNRAGSDGDGRDRAQASWGFASAVSRSRADGDPSHRDRAQASAGISHRQP